MNSHPQDKVVVRYPPSPTGTLHIGNMRTMLFNYLFARQHGGQIVMRFEDTDRERSDKAHEKEALYALDQLGMTFDEGPYRQSERIERYNAAIDALFEKGFAYEGEESKDGSGDKVIRFKNPNKKVTFADAVRGDITIDTTDFGDFVIARSHTNPLYHLTVVVDDIDMSVTHIIRGEDHITSTPRQILLIEALGGTVPSYAHLPLIVGEDNKKLGKRHGAVTYQEFEKLGYMSEAIVNYLALLGWNPGKGSEQEIFSMEELVAQFSLEGLQSSPAKFSYDKLCAVNRHYMQELSEDAFKEGAEEWLPEKALEQLRALSSEMQKVAYGLLRERIDVWSDIAAVYDTDLGWLEKPLNHEAALYIWKKGTKEDAHKHLAAVHSILENLKTWTPEAIKEALWPYAETQGRGDVLWPLRTSLTGAERSPDPFTAAALLGQEEALGRINSAHKALVV